MDTITTIPSLLKSNGSAQPVMVSLTPKEISLIAAAPDMMAALAAIAECRPGRLMKAWGITPIERPREPSVHQNMRDLARAALAKAGAK